MSAVNQPYVTASLVPDASVVSLEQTRLLIVGAIGSIGEGVNRPLFGAGTSAFLQASPNASYEQYSESAMLALLGAGSTFERWKAAKAGSNGVVPIDFLLTANTTTATTTLTVSVGAGELGGSLYVSVYDANQYNVTVDLSTAKTANELAAEIDAALSAYTTLPATVSVATNVVTLTWQDGFVPESTPIHVHTPIGSVASVAVSVSAQTAPDLIGVNAGLMDLIGDQRYTHIAWPDYFETKLNIVDDLLTERFNLFNDVASGAAWTTMTRETVIDLQTDTATLDTQNIIVVAAKLVNGLFDASIGADKTRSPDADVAFLAAAHARMLTPDASLVDLGFIADGTKDYSGGYHMASFPMHNIVIPYVKPANPRWYFTFAEQSLLNGSNVSTYGVNRSGTTTVSGNMLTMWKTDSAGNVNLTYQQVEYLYTAMTIREYMDSAARIKYANQRMTQGETVIGYSMVNQATVEEWVLSEYRKLGNIALVTKGAAADKSFRKALSVTLNPAQTRITIAATYEIVTHVGIVDFTIRTTTSYGA